MFKKIAPWALFCAMGLWPLGAWASGGGGVSSSTFRNILVLLAVIGVSYVITHALLDRLQRRFGVVTGVEYIVLGALVGPVLGFLDAATIAKFTPALVLGTGSLGLLTGLSLNFRRFEGRDFEAMRIALWVTLGTVLLVVVGPMLALYYTFGLKALAVWLPGLMCVGAVALVADTGPMAALRQFLHARGESAFVAKKVARLCSSLAVVGFGVLFCLFNPGSLVLPPQLAQQPWVESLQAMPMLMWLGIHVLIGGVMGLIFGMFLGRGYEGEKLLTVVVGMVIFTSGLAYYLRLSPIFVNFILGVVLINTNRSGEQIGVMLQSVERPLYITLFFFAGAALVPNVPWWVYGAVVPYLILRSLGRGLGGMIAVKTGVMEPKVPPLGRVLLAPGGLAVAMILDYEQIYGATPQAEAVYAGLLVAIVLSEILSYTRTKSWLIDFTDVPPTQLRRMMSGQDQEAEGGV